LGKGFLESFVREKEKWEATVKVRNRYRGRRREDELKERDEWGESY